VPSHACRSPGPRGSVARASRWRPRRPPSRSSELGRQLVPGRRETARGQAEGLDDGAHVTHGARFPARGVAPRFSLEGHGAHSGHPPPVTR
jgi:hypothetical protein